MSPIVRSGYSSAQPVYADPRWAAVRQVVLARDQKLCRLCGKPGRLAVAHFGNTSAMLERGENVFDPSVLFSAHQACHNRYAAGKLELLPIGERR